MLEKSGTIHLTAEDLLEAEKGKVTQRVKDTWNLGIEPLQEIIKNNAYATHKSIDNPQDIDKK